MSNPNSPRYSTVHVNNNLLCAVDVGTTGLEIGKHELIELAIIPLGPDYRPTRLFRYFHIRIKPENLDEMEEKELRSGKRELIKDCLMYGLERWTGVQRLEEWFESLHLPAEKKIVPVGSNYSFDRDFLIQFMGGALSYDYIFRSDFRDTMLSAIHHNDLADWHGARIPFPKYHLGYLCRILGVENPVRHRAVPDALASAEVYRRLMRYRDMFQLSPKQPDCEHIYDEYGVCSKCFGTKPQFLELGAMQAGIPVDEIHSLCTPAVPLETPENKSAD